MQEKKVESKVNPRADGGEGLMTSPGLFLVKKWHSYLVIDFGRCVKIWPLGYLSSGRQVTLTNLVSKDMSARVRPARATVIDIVFCDSQIVIRPPVVYNKYVSDFECLWA